MAGADLRAVAALLRSLLSQPAYRDLWIRYVRHSRTDVDCNQSAIAHVLALYLWRSGQRSDTRTDLARGLKDRVHRALKGEVLSAETLTWFIEAFDMSDDHAHQLRALRFGETCPMPDPVVDSLRSRQLLPLSQRHRTLSVFEHRIIGRSGSPVAHHTTRALTAREGRVYSYPFWLMPGSTGVQVRRGGRFAARRESPTGPIAEIRLNNPLEQGEVVSLEYSIDFDPSSDDVAVEYRRVAHERTDNLDIVVEFHPDCLPRGLWWTIWDDFRGGNVLHSEPAALDPDLCAHRFLPYLENAAAGFRWVW